MIKIGPAGSPGKSTLEGISIVSKSLDAMEVEFVRGVRMGDSLATEIGDLAKKLNVSLSIHAPYYINLASAEPEKITASIKRITDSLDKGELMGAKCVVVHAAYYGKLSHEECYQMVLSATKKIMDYIHKNKYTVKLAYETTGKKSQFGTVEELFQLHLDTGSYICFDFAHIYARQNGVIDYSKILPYLKKLDFIHCHFSGIEFTEKGEKKHLLLDYKLTKNLLGFLSKNKINCTIVCESPDPFNDAKKMKKWLNSD